MQVKSAKKRQNVDGILLVDKPAGESSNHVLQGVKRIFNARKAGHTGTLDPFASGLLVCCFGQSTKVSGLLLDADKEYLATLSLGRATSTGDLTGETQQEASVPALTNERVAQVLDGMLGGQDQIPPMYSALKVQGKRLYQLARAGVEVAREPRRITIHELQLQGLDNDFSPAIHFRVRCSKGTYVRTLGESIATALGTVGHLSALRRSGLGPFAITGARTPEQLAAMTDDQREAQLLGVDLALAHMPRVDLNDLTSADFVHGRATTAFVGELNSTVDKAPITGEVRAYSADGGFLGCGILAEDGRLQPKRLFIRHDKG